MLDAEGNVGLHPHLVGNSIFFSPIINITSSDRDVITSIRNTLGFGKIHERKQKNASFNSHHTLFVLSITQRDEILKFIRLIKNRCIIKRRQLALLEEALQYIPSYKDRVFYRNLDTILKLIHFAERIRQLNSKGKGWSKVSLGKLKKVAMKIYGNRKRKEARVANLDADLLKDLYWNKKLSSYEIAEIFGVSQSTVIKYMKLHNIPRRKRGGNCGAK